MKYKCWCFLFVGLLIFFACSNGNNEPGTEVSSSSYLAEEPSSASEPAPAGSSSSNVPAPVSSSSGGLSSSSSGASGSSSSSSVFSSSGSSSSVAASNVSSSSISSISSSSVAGNDGNLSYGKRFNTDMHGLTPGATTASVNLNWFSTSTNCSSTSTDDGKTLIRLFNATGGLVNTFSGTTAKGPTGKCTHKATITGLTPNTSYKYSVSNNGTDWSNDYSYKTPPSGSVFTFAVVSDPQVTTGNQDSNTKPKANPPTTGQGWKDIVKRVAEKDATFILCAGDQVDGGITYKEAEYGVFFAPEELRNIPLAPVVGNHDLHTEYFHHFNMPNLSSSGYGVYTGLAGNYYYLYNNILIVALNTGYLQKSDNVAAAVAEYKKTIEKAKSEHSGKYDWLIVQHHKSTTSISAHSADEDIGFLIKAGFEKLMTDQGVDIVISGHDHIHVRSHLMVWDDTKKYSVRSTDGKGTIYLTITTASGIKFYPPLFILEEGQENAGPFTEDYPVLVNGKRGASELRKAKVADTNTWPISTDFFVKTTASVWAPNYTPNYTIFEVNGKTIKATTRTSENALVDEFTLTPKGPR